MHKHNVTYESQTSHIQSSDKYSKKFFFFYISSNLHQRGPSLNLSLSVTNPGSIKFGMDLPKL